eukprot:751632-Hanusia_phi.AAC.1
MSHGPQEDLAETPTLRWALRSRSRGGNVFIKCAVTARCGGRKGGPPPRRKRVGRGMALDSFARSKSPRSE